MPCLNEFELTDISTGDDCNLKGGLKVGFWTKASNIDWDATKADPLLFDPATCIIKGYAMIAGATWHEILFKRKGSNYTQSYTRDNGSYDQQITNIFEGKGNTLRKALVNALNGCKIVYHAFDNNCSSRLFGKEYDGDDFVDPIETLRIRQHDDNSGDVGGDVPIDTVIFGGEAETPALYSDISLSDFRANYV